MVILHSQLNFKSEFYLRQRKVCVRSGYSVFMLTAGCETLEDHVVYIEES